MMKTKIMALIFLATVALSCATKTNPSYDNESEEEVWVCNNPGSAEHHKVCTEECLEPGNNHTYCFLLHESDCQGDLILQWQKDVCVLFGVANED